MRKCDHEDLAGRLLEHVFDRRREEAGLPPPLRRRADHDQIDTELLGLADDRLTDRARADFYRELGLRTICPTKTAISELLDAARACEVPLREAVPTT